MLLDLFIHKILHLDLNEISINQSFYFFQNSFIDGESPEIGQDWFGSFNEYEETMSGNCINNGDDLDGNEDTIECQDVMGMEFSTH